MDFMEITVEAANFKVTARQLNDSLHELHRPPGPPTMQVLFFHGFQQRYENAHLFTWAAGDESGVWPQTWLVEQFPDAHILSVSYYEGMLQESLNKHKNQGDGDMFIVVENLISDLLQAGIGQEPRSPVVLVGHSFGGLVVKQLCVNAFRQLGDTRFVDASKIELLNFVDNIKGLFFYATPHRGIEEKSMKLLKQALLMPTGPLLEYVKILSNITARLNGDFEKLCEQHKWEIAGLGENLPSKLGWSEGLIVPEGSSRYTANFNIAIGEDHISISRPKLKIAKSFTFLTSLLKKLRDDPQLFGLPGNWQYGVPDPIFGITDVLEDAKVELEKTAKLGLVGMGGVGKTTLAMALFNNLERVYQYTCFIKDVKNLPGPPHKRVMEAMLESLHYGGKQSTNKDSRLGFLKGKRLLLVLDDVKTEEDLEIVTRLQYHVHGSSRFIATSRDPAPLESRSHKLYHVKFLSPESSRELFLSCAFPDGLSPNDIRRDFVDGLVGKCGTLPLTLEVMGKHLRRKSEKIWKEAINALSDGYKGAGGAGFAKKILDILMLSYDGLDLKEKDMFLDASSVFYKEDLSIAMAAWYFTTDNLQETIWHRLVELSLVWEVFENGKVKIGMHEQLLTLGNILTSTPSKNGHYRRIWNDSEKALRLLSDNGDMDGLKEVIALKCCKGKVKRSHLSMSFPQGVKSTPENQISISGRKLQRMTEDLRYLEVDGNVTIYGDKEDKVVPFPTNLVCVSLRGVGQYFTQVFFDSSIFTRLAVLRLSDYDGKYLPESVSNLSALEILKLIDCDKLRSLPKSFGRLSALRDLEFTGCRKLRTLPESLGDLSRLSNLLFKSCDGLQTLPESFGNLSALSNLQFKGCERLHILPKSFGNLSALRDLELTGCGELHTLPESFGFLSALQNFQFKSCRGLQTLPESFGHLSALSNLQFESCYGLQTLPESFGHLSALSNLQFESCYGLQTLPESSGICQH